MLPKLVHSQLLGQLQHLHSFLCCPDKQSLHYLTRSTIILTFAFGATTGAIGGGNIVGGTGAAGKGA